jgi:hypothetical protein
MIQVFVALLFFAAAIYFYYYYRPSIPTIEILSAEEMQRVITTDADHYYDKFHAVDFKVRQVKNKHAYLDKISGSGCAADEEVIQKVKDCIETVNAQLSARRNETIHGIEIDTFLKIPWRIGFICDTKYENGLPHTRGDVIVLNNQDVRRRTVTEVCKLLIHEKSHVYQKKVNMSGYLKTKYTEVKQKDYKDETIPANPDTNDTVYKSNETDEVLEGKYRKNPRHFRDVLFTQHDHALEHPFESIAYNMEEVFY